MAELKGTFYGVSVGPGNPELMTLQAVRLIRQCPVLAAPQTASGQMLALDIARSALGEALDGKTIVPLYFAMSRDPAALAASHEKAAAAVRQYLDAGQDVAMLNLGDVSIYATFGYLQEILQAGGYATAMAAGVPSFCAAAARLNVPLTGGMDTPLTIAPGGWTDRVLEMPGTKVLMKAGRQLPVLLDTLQQADKLKKSALVCNCGLPDERVYPDLSLERPQEQAGYFATVLGQFTRNYTQTVKRAADNKRRYAPGWVHSTCLLRGFPKGAAPHLAHDFAEQSVVCYTLCRRCPENTVAAGEGKGI